MKEDRRRLCVFCGARMGRDPAFVEAARETGRLLAEQGIGLVYGGGRVGLMGVIADACLAHGGEVTGVIPLGLFEREIVHEGLTELVRVDSMHARKFEMTARADAFLVLPGGYGTLDETFEALTWRQLGIHPKPLGILDVAGFWSPLRKLIVQMQSAGFVGEEGPFPLFEADPALLIQRLMREVKKDHVAP